MRSKLKKLIMRYKKISALVIILFLIIISYSLYHVLSPPHLPPPDEKVVEVAEVQVKDIQQTVQFIGTIRSEQATTLVAKTKGILDRFVNSGQHVKKNELIAKIDNKDIERNYKLSQEMEQIAKIQYERFHQLQKMGVTSKNTVEEKESIWITNQKNLSDAKIAMDDINIYAPFDGIVGIFKIREGSQVQDGDAIVNFYDPSTIIVEFDVPIAIVQLVHDGSPVIINHKQYTLTHIQKMLDEDTHMSPAYASIQCDDCIIGGTTDVELVVNEKKATLVIPDEAVFLRNGKTYVYIVKKGKAILSPVELGIREKELIEITKGIQSGDQVIVRGQARLYPNAEVKIFSEGQDKKQ